MKSFYQLLVLISIGSILQASENSDLKDLGLTDEQKEFIAPMLHSLLSELEDSTTGFLEKIHTLSLQDSAGAKRLIGEIKDFNNYFARSSSDCTHHFSKVQELLQNKHYTASTLLHAKLTEKFPNLVSCAKR